MDPLKALRAKIRYEIYRLKGGFDFTMDGERFTGDATHWRYWRHVDSGKWEPHTLAIYRKLLGPQDAYLDIGAYIGPTALFASRLCRDVYCLEPDPRNHAALLENIELNAATSIRAREVGLYHENTKLRLGSPEGLGTSGSSIVFSGDKGTTTISVVTFAAALAYWNLEHVKLTKIDIEGAEFDLLPRIGAEVAEASENVYLSTHGPSFPVAGREAKMHQLEPFFAQFPYIYDFNLKRIAPESIARAEYRDAYVEFLLARNPL